MPFEPRQAQDPAGSSTSTRTARGARPKPSRQPGPLHGDPVAVKDLIDVAGMPTALGRGRAVWPSATRRSLRGCGNGARSSSARPAPTNSASARSPRARVTPPTRPEPRRLERRLGDRGRHGRRAARARHRHGGQRADPRRRVRRRRPLRRRDWITRWCLDPGPQLRPPRPHRGDRRGPRRRLDRARRHDRRAAGASHHASPDDRSAASSPNRSRPPATRRATSRREPLELAGPLTAAVRPSARDGDHRRGRRPPTRRDGRGQSAAGGRRRPHARGGRAPPAPASTSSAKNCAAAVGDGVLVTPHPPLAAALGRARRHRRPASSDRQADPALRPGQQLQPRGGLDAAGRAARRPRHRDRARRRAPPPIASPLGRSSRSLFPRRRSGDVNTT